MCRSIKQLRQADYQPTEEEIHAAALQFVRKVSGYRKPSQANQAAFDRAVADIAVVTTALLEQISDSRAAKPAALPLDARPSLAIARPPQID
jgi:hypothetical protein